MMRKTITRRQFTWLGAATCAAAGLSGVALSGCSQSSVNDETVPVLLAPAVSAASSARPAMVVAVQGGAVKQVWGDEVDPLSRGKLGAGDFAYAQEIQAQALSQPLVKSGGAQKAASWDDALSAAGTGPWTVVAGASPLARFCAYQMKEAGATVHEFAAESATQRAGTACAIGYSGFVPDVEHSRALLILHAADYGAGCADALAQLRRVRANGGVVLAADVRMDGAARVADEWLPIRPGSELALVLGVCAELVSQEMWDQAFVAAQGEGFAEWAEALRPWSRAKVAQVCGLEEGKISQIAAALAKVAPACSVVVGNGSFEGVFGSSAELHRAVALLNSMLGVWNQRGGAVVRADVFDDVLGDVAAVGQDTAGDAGALAAFADFNGGNLLLLDCDVASLLPRATVERTLQAAAVSVAVTSCETATSKLCDVVLPCATFLEDVALPEVARSAAFSVKMARPVLEAPEGRRSLAAIVSALSGTDVDVDAEVQRRLECVNLTAGAFSGSAAVADSADVTAEGALSWPTASGKIAFTSAASSAGISACPVDVEAYEVPDGQFAAIVGVPSFLVGAPTQWIRVQRQKCQLDHVWVNASDAVVLGVKTGDRVRVEANGASVERPVLVTDRIVSGAVFVPCVPDEGEQPSAIDLCALSFEDGYGCVAPAKTIASVRKAGA